MKALVIGAGIHGVTVACELAKSNCKVTLVDSLNEILLGTSNGTHNRVNMGYHYPRSIETAKECFDGYEYFKRHLPEALYYPSSCFYLIENNNSKVTGGEYKNFLNDIGLEYKESFPEGDLINCKNIDKSFKVNEPCYDVLILRRYFNLKIKELQIKLLLGFDITRGEINDNEVLIISKNGHNIKEKFDIIVNATYANTNNIQQILGCSEKRKKYIYQKTEVVVVHSELEIPALTVMDGPFITILPYAYDGHRSSYLVYDVVNSVCKEETNNSNLMPEDFLYKSFSTNYHKMINSGKRYYNFMEKLTPLTSLWATRPIPVDSAKDDYRNTQLLKHNNHKCFYSILEGKFVSAPSMSRDIVNKIMQVAK